VEDVSHPDSKRHERSPPSAAATSHDVERVRQISVELTSTECDSSASIVKLSSSTTDDVVDFVDASDHSSLAGNHRTTSSASNPASVGNLTHQPVSSSTRPEELQTPAAAGSLPTGEPSSSGAAGDIEPVGHTFEPTHGLCQGSDVSTTLKSTQDTAAAATSDSNKPTGSSTDDIESTLLCVICQEILYKCVRSGTL